MYIYVDVWFFLLFQKKLGKLLLGNINYKISQQKKKTNLLNSTTLITKYSVCVGIKLFKYYL